MKLKSLTWLAVPLCALAGCDNGTGADGYVFEGKEFDRAQISVTAVQHATIADLRRAAIAKGASIEPGRDLMAFAVVNTARPTCELHLVDPANSYSPEWMGHELAHCLHGRWHDRPPPAPAP